MNKKIKSEIFLFSLVINIFIITFLSVIIYITNFNTKTKNKLLPPESNFFAYSNATGYILYHGPLRAIIGPSKYDKSKKIATALITEKIFSQDKILSPNIFYEFHIGHGPKNDTSIQEEGILLLIMYYQGNKKKILKKLFFTYDNYLEKIVNFMTLETKKTIKQIKRRKKSIKNHQVSILMVLFILQNL